MSDGGRTDNEAPGNVIRFPGPATPRPFPDRRRKRRKATALLLTADDAEQAWMLVVIGVALERLYFQWQCTQLRSTTAEQWLQRVGETMDIVQSMLAKLTDSPSSAVQGDIAEPPVEAPVGAITRVLSQFSPEAMSQLVTERLPHWLAIVLQGLSIGAALQVLPLLPDDLLARVIAGVTMQPPTPRQTAERALGYLTSRGHDVRGVEVGLLDSVQLLRHLPNNKKGLTEGVIRRLQQDYQSESIETFCFSVFSTVEWTTLKSVYLALPEDARLPFLRAAGPRVAERCLAAVGDEERSKSWLSEQLRYPDQTIEEVDAVRRQAMQLLWQECAKVAISP